MRLPSTIAAVILIGLSATAQAQESIVEGSGYRVGEATYLHPRAGLEAGYISNVFYMAENSIGAPVLKLLADFVIASEAREHDTSPPGFGVDAEEPDAKRVLPKVRFRAGMNIAREQYLHERGTVSEQSNFSGGAHGDVTFNPDGMVSFNVRDRFVRHTRPVNLEDTRNLNRLVNHARLALDFKPGGRALTAGLRYENTIDVFESDESSFADRIQHLIGLNAGWQYLPVTKFSFDASIGFFGQLGDTSLPDGSTYKRSSMPLRVQLGGSTAITEMTTVEAHLGFGKGFYSAAQDFTNVIGGVRGGWRYSPLGRATLAYQYGFTDSVNANFFRDHAVIAKLDQQLQLLLLSASLGLHLRGYRGVPTGLGGPSSRDDLILVTKVSAQYLYRDWLAFTGDLIGMVDQTDYRYAPDPTGTVYDPSFNRWEVWLGSVAAF